MALIILAPAAAAIWQAFTKVGNPEPPDVVSLVVTAGGAVVVNFVCSWLLARVRHHGGSLPTAAFLAARNDVVVNLLIIVMGVLTAVTASGWPDIVLGVVIVALNLTAAKRECGNRRGQLAARALAGDIDDD